MTTRAQADLNLASEIEQFLPEFRMLVSRLRREGAVIGQEAADLAASTAFLETAAARLTLRANETGALLCEGSDPIADAERTWPNG